MDLTKQSSPESQAPQPVEQSKYSAGPSNQKFWLLGVIFVLLIAAAAVIYMQTIGAEPREEQTNAASISITGNGFEPSTLKVKKGQTVTWVNQDVQSHELGADAPNPNALNSEEPLKQGDNYSVTFEEEGTFHYHDVSDPVNKQGTIIVE